MVMCRHLGTPAGNMCVCVCVQNPSSSLVSKGKYQQSLLLIRGLLDEVIG